MNTEEIALLYGKIEGLKMAVAYCLAQIAAEDQCVDLVDVHRMLTGATSPQTSDPICEPLMVSMTDMLDSVFMLAQRMGREPDKA